MTILARFANWQRARGTAFANDPSTNAGVTAEQLRVQLDQIMKAEG